MRELTRQEDYDLLLSIDELFTEHPRLVEIIITKVDDKYDISLKERQLVP